MNHCLNVPAQKPTTITSHRNQFAYVGAICVAATAHVGNLKAYQSAARGRELVLEFDDAVSKTMAINYL